MAKLGYLFLNQGQWDGKEVVPASWVTASTAQHANQGDKKEYGYRGWIDPNGKWYAALGRAGQHIFVYPAENLVVVFTAGLPFTNDADLIPLQELLNGYILPAVKSDRPLPANPDGQARLTAGIKALAEPMQTAPSALPAIAAEISGKTYTLADNPFGWQSLAFTFQDGTDEARVLMNGTFELPVGLDNVYRFAGSPFPQGYRGRWENQDTFVIEDMVLGQMSQATNRIQFTGDAIRITRLDKYSGSQFDIQGAQSLSDK